jgi:YhcH/YjgK/YiaL family protein
MQISIKKLGLLLLAGLQVVSVSAQSEHHNMSKRKAKKWFKSGAWAGGFTATPHASIDKQTFAYQYAANKRLWDTTFAFLRTHDLSKLEKGDYQLAGDSAVVKVSYGPPKAEAEAKWEAHKDFIDVQLVGQGKERIGVAPLAQAKETVAYDAKKDVANYTADGKYFVAEPGIFFIFFPQDVHRPGLKVEEGMVRKIVVKIRVAE